MAWWTGCELVQRAADGGVLEVCGSLQEQRAVTLYIPVDASVFNRNGAAEESGVGTQGKMQPCTGEAFGIRIPGMSVTPVCCSCR